jgi:hypothetical protein
MRFGLAKSGAIEYVAPCRVIGILVAVCILFFAAPPARAQISPGPLSKAHESLNGATDCTTCHQFGAAEPTYKCLDCHKEINHLLAFGLGYHARLKMSKPTGRDCVRCHLEHNGSDFQLVHWDRPFREFNHREAGYTLEGKHANLSCEKCHTVAHMDPAEKALMRVKDLSKSYLGLSRNCVTCHEDVHKGDLGSECQRCHNFTDWKQASQFDHSKTKYPLTGMHLKVACDKCHVPSPPDNKVKFTGLKFEGCIDCHTDPHRGEFKSTCESCHNTGGWKNISMSMQFDHSNTKFPLLGAHTKVGCGQCHAGGDFRKPLPFDKCMDCHRPDPHKGQFQARSSGGECKECHTVNSWKPSLFGSKEHAATQYPLLGKHADVECAKCHIPAGVNTLYKVKFAQCMDCHKDVHDGQFAKEPYNNRCESCHTVNDFHRSRFTIAMHRKTQFPLEGAHAVVPCIDCHKEVVGARFDKTLPFDFKDRSCTTCHVDPHHGQFDKQMALRAANGAAMGCEACHNVKSWVNAKGFDHSKTDFPLIGAHRSVACSSCHKAAAGVREVTFKGTTKQCEDCHSDVHAGQFTSDNTTRCAACHNSILWVPSTFDHDKRTSFPLTGGHARIACDRCHTQTKNIGDDSIVIYHLATSKCSDCHMTSKSSVGMAMPRN